MKKHLFALLILIALIIFTAAPVWAAEEGDNSGTAVPGNTLPSGNSLSPNIIVSKFSTGADAVTAGRDFTLTYTLYNTNSSISVQNVMVKVNGGETFSLAKDSDTYYIDKIKAKGGVSHSSSFTSSVETGPGSYPITLSITFEYYDDGAKYSGTSELSISIPVVQAERVQIIKAGIGSESEPVYVNEEYGVDYDFINTGFSKMLNTELRLYNNDNGDYITSAYLGTVNPSTEMSGSSYLYATFGSTGEKNLKLVVAYEDQNMNTYTVEKEFTVKVEEAPAPVETEDIEEGGSFLIWGLGLILLIAAAAVLIVVLRRWRRKKRQAAEFWDDDEDDLEDEEPSQETETESGSPSGQVGEDNEDN